MASTVSHDSSGTLTISPLEDLDTFLRLPGEAFPKPP